MISPLTMVELEYELAITNHNVWIRILPMHMISPITMDELTMNYEYDITNHNEWIRKWTMNMI